MTIASDDNRKAGPYTCNGATVTFSFSFKVFAASTDLAVVLADADGDETDLVYSTDYSVSLNSDQNANPGGTITTVSTYATGYFITILSDVPATQNTSIPSPSAFSPTVIEAALDRLTALVLDARTSLARVLRGPRSDDDDIVVLPPAAQRALKTLYFDATGQPTVVNSTGDTSVSGAMEPVVTASTVDVGRALLGADTLAVSNVTFTAVANAGAMTISLKGDDGNDHSAGNPGYVPFFAPNLAAVPIWKTLTSPLSITIPSGATLGAVANVPIKVWVVVGYRGALAVDIGVINTLSVSAGFPADQNFEIWPLSATGWTPDYSTISGAANSAGNVFTSTIPNSAVDLRYAVIGFIEFNLATPGTWIDGQAYQWTPGSPLPGECVRTWGRRSAAVATGATVLPIDDTIPQKTEGVLCMSAGIGASPSQGIGSSYCNLLKVSVDADLASSNTDNVIAGALFVNTDADAVAVAQASRPATANAVCHLRLDYIGPNVGAGALGPIGTVDFRAGTASAGTTTFNGSAAARRFGGRMSSQIACHEIMT